MEINMPVLPSLDPLGGDLTGLTAQTRNKDPRAIDAAARGFESLLASMMLKQMRQTLEPGTLFSGDKADVLGGLFDLYMGQHMTQGRGLGIADMVKKQLLQMQARKL
jgi:Rod binding domain-containing protein